jgi:hypothetical protein
VGKPAVRVKIGRHPVNIIEQTYNIGHEPKMPLLTELEDFLFCFYKYVTPTALGVDAMVLDLCLNEIYFEGRIMLLPSPVGATSL